MTKQEQIINMAVLGCVRNPKAHTAKECTKCDFKKGMCNAYRHAEALYEAGYRKISEDSVILTKEDYIDLSRTYVKEQKEQAVKEFVERVKVHAERCYDWAVAKIVSAEVGNVLEELLKEYEK